MSLEFIISDQTQKVQFTYKNWRGETSQRRAIFTKLFFGSNDYHKEPQWLMEGIDLDKKARRTYALNDITDLESYKEPPKRIGYDPAYKASYKTLQCEFCDKEFLGHMVAAAMGNDGYTRCADCGGLYEVEQPE